MGKTEEKDRGKEAPVNHELCLVNRKRLHIGGIEKVYHFNEVLIKTKTVMGMLEIKGQNLFIESLDLEKKELAVTGEIKSLQYEDSSVLKKQKGGLGKWFK